MNRHIHFYAKGIVVALGIMLLAGSPVWAKQYQLPSSMPGQHNESVHIVPVLNEDQFEGNWKQLKGALKENWGEFTDDDLQAIEGRAERFEGIVQERYGDRKEEVKEWVDNYLENHPYDPHQDKTH